MAGELAIEFVETIYLGNQQPADYTKKHRLKTNSKSARNIITCSWRESEAFGQSEYLPGEHPEDRCGKMLTEAKISRSTNDR